MQSSDSARQTAFVLGATGGCTNAALTKILQSNMYDVFALVRTPAKLITQLRDLQGLGDSELSRLETISGNATDSAAIGTALQQIIERTGRLPNLIVSGLGATPEMTWSMSKPLSIIKIDQPTLCQDAARTLVSVLREFMQTYPELTQNRPDLVFISTTGITRGPEDVPYGMRTMYHTGLAVPHADKKEMENTFRDQANLSDGSKIFTSVTALRPTLLGGTGAVKSAELYKVKAGVESDPAQGWAIKREDVGVWMWENVIRPGAIRPNGQSWRGEMISLTRAGKQ